MSEELKPCPFCQGTKVFIYADEATIGIPAINGRQYYGVYCYECGSRTDNFEDITEELAIKRWNRRCGDE